MKNFGFLLIAILASLTLTAQSYSVVPTASTLTIEGTSSLHDWEMEAEKMSGSADLSISGESVDVKQISFTVPVESLKSGKKAMDKNALKALKSDDHPSIKYTAEKVSSGANGLTADGYLELAGARKPVKVIAKPLVDGNSVTFAGSVPLKMTDFGMDPPTALLGTLKTGDDITIHFNVQYKSN